MYLHVNRKGVAVSTGSGPYSHTLAISIPRGKRGWGAIYLRTAYGFVTARGWGADRLPRGDSVRIRSTPLVLRA